MTDLLLFSTVCNLFFQPNPIKLTTLVATPLFLIGCTNNDNDSRYIEKEEVDEWDQAFMGEGFIGAKSFGIEVQGFELDLDEAFYGYFEMEGLEHPLVARIGNLSIKDHYFALKIFLNYEEASFRVLGEDNYVTEFIILVESGYKIEIPFVLEIDQIEMDQTFKLTAGIFIDPNRHAMDLPFEELPWMEQWDNFATVLNFDLSFGTGSDIVLDASYTEILARRENQFFANLQVNTDFGVEAFLASDFSIPPDNLLQVRAGEEVELAFFTNPHVFEETELENYLILAMLDWQQIQLNHQPFLLVDTRGHGYEHPVDHGTFTFTAPTETGFYEFVAIIVSNPTARNSWQNFVPLDVANRFTIEVVE